MKWLCWKLYVGGHAGPFVAELGVEAEDEELLVGREGALLEIRAEVVGPAETAALSTAGQTGVLLDGVPVALSVLPHVLHQDRVFRRRPRSLLQTSIPASSAVAPRHRS